MEDKCKAKRRRRERRAQQLRAAIISDTGPNKRASEDDSCDEVLPLVRTKPPRPRKKIREPLFEEDLLDGFAMLAFKSYDDLERCVRTAEKAGSRILEPCPDRSTKTDARGVRRINRSIQSNTVAAYNNNNKPAAPNDITGGGSHSSSEQGYICDSESEDGKVSDAESDLFRATSKSGSVGVSAGDESSNSTSASGAGVNASLPPSAGNTTGTSLGLARAEQPVSLQPSAPLPSAETASTTAPLVAPSGAAAAAAAAAISPTAVTTTAFITNPTVSTPVVTAPTAAVSCSESSTTTSTTTTTAVTVAPSSLQHPITSVAAAPTVPAAGPAPPVPTPANHYLNGPTFAGKPGQPYPTADPVQQSLPPPDTKPPVDIKPALDIKPHLDVKPDIKSTAPTDVKPNIAELKPPPYSVASNSNQPPQSGLSHTEPLPHNSSAHPVPTHHPPYHQRPSPYPHPSSYPPIHPSAHALPHPGHSELPQTHPCAPSGYPSHPEQSPYPHHYYPESTAVASTPTTSSLVPTSGTATNAQNPLYSNTSSAAATAVSSPTADHVSSNRYPSCPSTIAPPVTTDHPHQSSSNSNQYSVVSLVSNTSSSNSSGPVSSASSNGNSGVTRPTNSVPSPHSHQGRSPHPSPRLHSPHLAPSQPPSVPYPPSHHHPPGHPPPPGGYPPYPGGYPHSHSSPIPPQSGLPPRVGQSPHPAPYPPYPPGHHYSPYPGDTHASGPPTSSIDQPFETSTAVSTSTTSSSTVTHPSVAPPHHTNSHVPSAGIKVEPGETHKPSAISTPAGAAKAGSLTNIPPPSPLPNVDLPYQPQPSIPSHHPHPSLHRPSAAPPAPQHTTSSHSSPKIKTEPGQSSSGSSHHPAATRGTPPSTTRSSSVTPSSHPHSSLATTTAHAASHPHHAPHSQSSIHQQQQSVLQRHSPRQHDPHNPPSSHYGFHPPTGHSTPTSLSKPWASPVSSLSSSSSAARLSSLSRGPAPNILPQPSFPLAPPPVSAPLPPTGMFAPPVLTSTSLLPSHLAAADPLVQSDLLRRELDSRFLATQDRSLSVIGASALSSVGGLPALLRTDVHHHQHQHTHVHQHLLPHMGPHPPPPTALVAPAPPIATLPTPAAAVAATGPTGLFSSPAAPTPSLFKEVSKVGMSLENGLYRGSSGLSGPYPPGLSSHIVTSASTPFAPPAHPSSLQSKKSGRWNAMHVRIAWEIYYHQQKQAAEKSGSANKIGVNNADMMHPPNSVQQSAPPSMFAALPRPPNMPPMMPGAGPSPRFESSMMSHSHLTPSIPVLAAGLRYPGNGQAPGPPHLGASFHHHGPTSMSGPPPGSMFSREGLTPMSLTYPSPSQAHDPWRLRPPAAYNSASPWSVYERREVEEREEKDRREREKKHREEHDRKERERAEERERKAREKDKEERERREAEREREREKRIEHEKERMSRVNELNHVGPGGTAPRRDASRSPLRTSADIPQTHLTAPHPAPPTSHPAPAPHQPAAVIHTSQPTAPPPPGPGPPPSSAVSTHTSNTSHTTTTAASVTVASTTTVSTPTTTAVSVPSTTAAARTASSSQSNSKSDHRPPSRPASRPSSGPNSRPNSRPSSKPADPNRARGDAKDEVMIVGSKEAVPRPTQTVMPPHSLAGMVMHHPSGALMPPQTMASVNSLERARLMSSGYPPGPSMWNDPFRGAVDPYRAVAVNNDALAAARYELLAREHMRDPLRDSLDRAREEHLIRSNPLGNLILSERYREHQARELFERERQLAAAAAGYYPPGAALMAPHHAQHLLGPQLKSSPLGHPGHHALMQHAHHGLSSLHPGHHPGHPPHPMAGGIPPGMPPPLISSRPPDKKDEPR